MMAKPFAWSFSTLDQFELCPRKYYHERVAKTHVGGTSAVGEHGKDGHKQLELRLLKGTPLKLGMTYCEPTVAAVAKAPGQTYGEQQMAITRDYRPTGWFASDVWCRAIADAAKHNGKGFVLVDWKFGRFTEKWRDQGLVMANLALCSLPEVETVGVTFVWFGQGNPPPVSQDVYTRETIYRPWAEILLRVDRMENDVARENFPARQNHLCKKYCPVKECPYHGR